MHAVPPPQPRLIVAQALAKGDRGELAVELMTEVGVDAVIPWAAERSITKWQAERGAKALAKWRSTAREAAKQSRRAWLPEVTELATPAVLATVTAWAAELGTMPRELRTGEKSLEDVFLALTGRELRS